MLDVIGVGLGRTGTKSLRTALRILLDGRVLHMLELLEGETLAARIESPLPAPPRSATASAPPCPRLRARARR